MTTQTDDTRRILEMLSQGKITVDDADRSHAGTSQVVGQDCPQRAEAAEGYTTFQERALARFGDVLPPHLVESAARLRADRARRRSM